MKPQDTGLFNADKNDISSFLKQTVASFLLCSLLCTFILFIYGAVVFNDHVRLLDMFRGIVAERAEHDLKSIFNGYFYWSEMVDRVRSGDTPFIEDQLEDLKGEYAVAGLSVYQNGEAIYSNGPDLPTSFEEVDYRVDGDGKLLAGKSFLMINDEDETQMDLSCSIWLDMSDEMKKMGPIMFSFQLTSKLEGSHSGKTFLGDTRIKTDFLTFLLDLVKREPSIPVSVFALSVLIYLLPGLSFQPAKLRNPRESRLSDNHIHADFC